MQLIYKNKFIPWLLCFLLFAQGVGLYHITAVFAGNASTSAGVNNKAPYFTTGPADDSGSSTPINVGSNVTFTATAGDKNSDHYYLAVCQTSTAPTPGANAAPTCNGGTFCVTSTDVAAGTSTSCTYPVASGDAPSKAWYAFVCDKLATGALCSSYSQGSGEPGVSPFYVNTIPTFTAFADDAGSGKDPGSKITWTSTASDADGDQVTLYVCKTASFNGSTCAGGEWCHSSASASNPTCDKTLDSVMQDKNWEAYGYIVDSRGTQASVGGGSKQGTDSVLTVNNVAPTISASTIALVDTDGADDLVLKTSGAETTGFKVTFTVTDKNSCLNASSGNEIASALINVRRSGIAKGSCAASGDYDANNCYPDADASWNPSCTQTGTCGGSSDDTIEWTCTFPLQYHADPTDLGTYASENWVADVTATDDNSASTGSVTATTGNELDQFADYTLDKTTINYGAMDPGAASADQTIAMSATGNVGLDENLSGGALTSGSDTIAVGQQKYKATSGGGWTGTALTGVATRFELNVPKTTITGTPESKTTYWVLQVPDPQPVGTYSGTNTIEGVTGN